MANVKLDLLSFCLLPSHIKEQVYLVANTFFSVIQISGGETTLTVQVIVKNSVSSLFWNT
jgi:hypothetical protein